MVGIVSIFMTMCYGKKLKTGFGACKNFLRHDPIGFRNRGRPWVEKCVARVFQTDIGRKKIPDLPSWEPVKTTERIPIRIRPGQAFGTGYHESTALCLKCMEELDFTGMDVLDAGCGSGILSIAAAKLGARSITGIDHEDEAVYEAAENAALNGVASTCRIISGKIEELMGDFDCLIGNIHAEFFEHHPGLPGRLAEEKGYAILSGFTSVSLSNQCKITWSAQIIPQRCEFLNRVNGEALLHKRTNKIYRFFNPETVAEDEVIYLDTAESHHARNVLRLRQGEQVQVLNGKGLEVTGIWSSRVDVMLR